MPTTPQPHDHRKHHSMAFSLSSFLRVQNISRKQFVMKLSMAFKVVTALYASLKYYKAEFYTFHGLYVYLYCILFLKPHLSS